MAKTVKITIEVSSETVKELDKIAVDELTGSRGRAVDWLVRETKVVTSGVE